MRMTTTYAISINTQAFIDELTYDDLHTTLIQLEPVSAPLTRYKHLEDRHCTHTLQVTQDTHNEQLHNLPSQEFFT